MADVVVACFSLINYASRNKKPDNFSPSPQVYKHVNVFSFSFDEFMT